MVKIQAQSHAQITILNIVPRVQLNVYPQFLNFFLSSRTSLTLQPLTINIINVYIVY